MLAVRTKWDCHQSILSNNFSPKKHFTQLLPNLKKRELAKTMNQTHHSNTHKPFVFLLSFLSYVLLLTNTTFAQNAEPNQCTRLFDEKILTLQTEKIKAEKPKQGAISIPYTRIDVSVHNGIVFTRFLQVYHNHSKTNQGYALNLPITPDTMITQYTIWDRGTRYPGVIEDRETAETIYKKVTGDEAPTMNKDPGLLRRTFGRFEMRVFPIFPEEDKQIEIVFVHRLSMKKGLLSLAYPLQKFVTSNDRRHGKISSLRTDLSLSLVDKYPFRDLQVPAPFKASLSCQNSLAYKASLQANDTFFDSSRQKNPEIHFSLDTGGKTVTDTKVYSQGQKKFFLSRIISAKPRVIEKPIAEPESGNKFFMGVWHSQKPDPFSNPRFGLEFLAYATLTTLQRNDTFHGSWFLGNLGKGKRKKNSLVKTPSEYFVYQASKALNESMKTMRKKKSNAEEITKAPVPNPYEDLARLLDNGGIPLVYLFLNTLTDEEYTKLQQLVVKHSKVDFILVTMHTKDLPESLQKQANVSYYTAKTGWKYRRFRSTTDKSWLETPFSPEQNSLKQVLIPAFPIASQFGDFQDFYSNLPNTDPLYPSLNLQSTAKLKNVFYWTEDFSLTRRLRRNEPSPTEPETKLIWLSGIYQGEGEVTGTILSGNYPLGIQTMFKGSKQKNLRMHSLPIATYLSPTDKSQQNRFVGAFHARHLASRKNFHRLVVEAKLRQNKRVKRKMPPEEVARLEREREKLRQESVALSRTYGFISSETAFLALPLAMRKKYQIKPARIGDISPTGNSMTMPSSQGGVPEPSTWVLLGVALLLMTGMGLYHKYRKKLDPMS
ncbi:MAG: VIT domain-containing protein [Spirochaetota bacterium]